MFFCQLYASLYHGQVWRNLKPTPRVVLRLGSYTDTTQQNWPLSQIQEPQSLKGRQPGPGDYSHISENFKVVRKFAAQKVPGNQKILVQKKDSRISEKIRLRIWLKGNLSLIKVLSSQYPAQTSGSRGIHLSQV